MVNVKPPARPVHKHGLWPPKNAKAYTILDTDDWWKVAKKHNIDVRVRSRTGGNIASAVAH